MKLVFDVGMYDASDTAYYLEQGCKVIAVEANPALVQRARSLLKSYVESKRLEVVHAAISTDHRNVELTISGDDLGSSSVSEEQVATKFPIGKFSVPGITTSDLLRQHGVPFYLKVDIEGADALCIRSLSPEFRPSYVSFEIGSDFEDLLNHLTSIGYSRFKIINQLNFRELDNEDSLRDRFAMALVRRLGYSEPMYVKRNGRFFKAAHSTGPVPWESDGAWALRDDTLARWKRARSKPTRNVWYDCHAWLG